MQDVARILDLVPQRASADFVVGGRVKRAFDLVLALLAVLMLAPALCLIAVAIWSTGGRPVFYHQLRLGYNGSLFPCYKFRTMCRDADAALESYLAANPEAAREWRETRKLKNDPRVTPLGLFLRKSSLDELPQLFNILRGDMTFVGPRPIPAHVDDLSNYGHSVKEYVTARPGLTGLWQISGRSDVSYQARVSLDMRYIQQWSFWTDVLIILKTVPVVLFSRGSY